MFAPNAEQMSLLQALIAAPLAWSGTEDLARAAGQEHEAALDHWASLDAAGWVEVWERPEGPVVTLSPWGAEQLSVHLVEVGSAELPRWARIGDPEPPALRVLGVAHNDRGAELQFVVSPELPPDVMAEAAERAAALGAAPAGRGGREIPLPRPSLLVGDGLTPWPGPGWPDSGPCPSCHARPIPPQAYCLCCDRWGLDRPERGPAASPAPAPARRRSRRPTPNEPRRGPSADRAERDKRKRKRASRFARRFGNGPEARPPGAGAR